MNNHIPSGAARVLERLIAAGHSAYVVGGAVRDVVMYGAIKPESDCDITTSARPDETARVFADLRVIETGIKHGTVTVLLDGIPYEITTFRTERGYEDRRHPDKVTFVTDVAEDLARRDFTMNAMALSLDGSIVDPFGGAEDIAQRLIRAVGDPATRFSEDALRILRGLRFAARLGFDIEPATASAMLETAHLVAHVSGERVREELAKLLLGEHATPLLVSHRATLARALPDFADATPAHFDAAAGAVSRQRPEFAPRLAALLSCLPDPAPMLDRLVLDRRTRDLAELLLREAPALTVAPTSEREQLRLASRLGAPNASALLAYRAAIEPSALAASAFASASSQITHLAKNGACFSLDRLALSGGDLVALGYPPSKQISILLNRLLDAVIDGRVENTRAALISYLATLK